MQGALPSVAAWSRCCLRCLRALLPAPRSPWSKLAPLRQQQLPCGMISAKPNQRTTCSSPSSGRQPAEAARQHAGRCTCASSLPARATAVGWLQRWRSLQVGEVSFGPTMTVLGMCM